VSQNWEPGDEGAHSTGKRTSDYPILLDHQRWSSGPPNVGDESAGALTLTRLQRFPASRVASELIGLRTSPGLRSPRAVR
jgi:hypothetical protein